MIKLWLVLALAQAVPDAGTPAPPAEEAAEEARKAAEALRRYRKSLEGRTPRRSAN